MKMKNKWILAVGAMAMTAIGSTLIAKRAKQPIEVESTVQYNMEKGLTAINVNVPVQIEYLQGAPDCNASVVAKGLRSTIDKIKVEEKGGTLKMTPAGKKVVFDENDRIIIYITSPDIRSIELGSSASLKAESITTSELNIIGRGSAEIKIDRISCAETNFNVYGSVDFEGKSWEGEKLNISVAGAADVDIDTMTGGQFKFDISGSGELDCKKMTFTKMMGGITGAGNLNLAGNVGNLALTLSGAGEVNAAGLISDTAEIKVSGAGSVVCNSRKLKSKVTGVGSIKNQYK